MLKIFRLCREYCNLAAKEALIKALNKTVTSKKIDFKTLRHTSKVPAQPIVPEYTSTGQPREIDIDAKTIQLLERLSLVDLDSKAALETLKSSIQFADKIVGIETADVEPLYTVLEKEYLQLREDLVTEGDCRQEILQNAKITDEDYYVSPPGNIPLEQEEKSFEDPKSNKTTHN